MKLKLTKSTLRKLIKEEVQNAVKEGPAASGFKPSSSMASLVANLPNSTAEAEMLTTGRDPENAKLIVTILKGIVGDNKEKAKAALMQALEKQASAAAVDGAPVLSPSAQADIIRAFFENGRMSFFRPVPMQESKNISLKLKNRRATHPIAKGRSIFS